MQGMRESRHESALRGISPSVPGMLRTPGAIDTPQQAARGSDAGIDRSLSAPVESGSTWPGRDFGVRAPYPGETQLSWCEVMEAVRRGLL